MYLCLLYMTISCRKLSCYSNMSSSSTQCSLVLIVIIVYLAENGEYVTISMVVCFAVMSGVQTDGFSRQGRASSSAARLYMHQFYEAPRCSGRADTHTQQQHSNYNIYMQQLSLLCRTLLVLFLRVICTSCKQKRMQHTSSSIINSRVQQALPYRGRVRDT